MRRDRETKEFSFYTYCGPAPTVRNGFWNPSLHEVPSVKKSKNISRKRDVITGVTQVVVCVILISLIYPVKTVVYLSDPVQKRDLINILLKTRVSITTTRIDVVPMTPGY